MLGSGRVISGGSIPILQTTRLWMDKILRSFLSGLNKRFPILEAQRLAIPD